VAYGNLRLAFLFQTIVALISVVSVLLMGRTGLAFIGLLFFRPFVLGRDPDAPGEPVRDLYRRTFRISAVLTAVFLVLLYIARETGVSGETDDLVLLMIILPSAMLIHGVTGYVLSRNGG
jgi:hypothetical protein